MARFGKLSMSRLDGVHPLQVDWALRVVSIIDVGVARDGGVRSLTTQGEFVAAGASKTMDSFHLIQDDGYGHAIDLYPYPVDWSDLRRFHIMGGIGIAVAKMMELPITWGGRWNPEDDRFKVPNFNDMGHFQINVPYYPTARSA